MRKILLLFVVSFFCQTTHAGNIQVAQWLPWKTISQELEALPVTFESNTGSMSFQWGEFTPIIDSTAVRIQGSVNQSELSGEGVSASSSALSAQITLGGIHVNQTLVRIFNGNRLTIRVNVSCLPITLTIARFSLSSNAKFQAQNDIWSPALTNLDLTFSPEAWSLSAVKCSGVQGIDHDIASAIATNLSDPSVIESILRPWLAQKINQAWTESWKSLVNDLSNDLEVTELGAPLANGFFIYANLPISTRKDIKLPELNDDFSLDHPQLILTQEGFSALLEDKLIALAPQKFNLQNNASFAGLMKSRLKQTFAWPDLKRFSSQTPFYLSTYKDQALLTLKNRGPGKWAAQVNANGVLTTEIGGAPIDYILWGMGVSTSLSVSLKDSVLTLNSGTASTNIAWAFSPIYQMLFKPNPSISIDILKNALNDSFSNKTTSQTLPIITINNQIWKLQNWAQRNNLITMDWSL